MMDPNVLKFMDFVKSVIDFVSSVLGIITAVIALLAALPIIIDLINKKEGKMQKITKYIKSFVQVLLIIFLIILGSGILILNYATEPLPPNVRLTNEAWKAYDNKKYEQAIKKAEECIKEFERDAIPEQKELEKSNAPLPPLGKVSEEEKKTIFNRGLLNDVATCWLIKGLSLEKLGRIQEAIKAYCKAAKFTYARTYDPSWDGFWSPSKKAKNSLSYLNGTCE